MRLIKPPRESKCYLVSDDGRFKFENKVYDSTIHCPSAIIIDGDHEATGSYHNREKAHVARRWFRIGVCIPPDPVVRTYYPVRFSSVGIYMKVCLSPTPGGAIAAKLFFRRDSGRLAFYSISTHVFQTCYFQRIAPTVEEEFRGKVRGHMAENDVKFWIEGKHRADRDKALLRLDRLCMIPVRATADPNQDLCV